jgi:inward rectifier potassium channel
MVTARPKINPRYTRVRQGGFEVYKAGNTYLDFSDPYHLAVALPWPAFIACGTLALVLLNFLFAAFYLLHPGAVRNLPPGDFARAFFFSLETLSTVGYGEMSPFSLYGYLVAGIEMAVGMAFVAILTGILFVRFSRSHAGILFADTAVIAGHNGKATLMVRIGNGRTNMLTEASARLSVLLKETNEEGQVFRRYHNLQLICSSLPAFPLTWTLMHTIDASSPLYECGPAELKAAWARLFLAVEATDGKLGRQVKDLADYDDQRILFGAHYTDAITYDDRGLATADLSRLSHVEYVETVRK